MSKYINLILVGFIVLWLNQNATTHDKLAVRNGINWLFNEPKSDNYVSLAGLPLAESIANTNIAGWFLVINEEQLDNLRVPAERKTLAYLDNWRDTNLDNPAHLKWRRGESWEQILADEGMRIRTNGVINP